MQFDPFANKLNFESFTLTSAPCPKCACTQVLIAPTQNTHAASARCPKCGKFYRWLGKRELESLAMQHRNANRQSQQAVAEGTARQSAGTTNPASLDNEHSETVHS